MDDATTPLFRTDARHPSQGKTLGSIIVARPRAFTVLSGMACAIAMLVVYFLGWGTYTKRSTSTGQLIPDAGLIKVHAPQYGTIIEKHVAEGQSVQRGDVLYVLSSERRSAAFGETQAKISQQVAARVESLREQISNAKRMSIADLATAEEQLGTLKRELDAVERLAESMLVRVRLAEEKHDRYAKLREQGFVSEEQLLAARVEALDQRVRLDDLERERISLRRRIVEQRATLETLPIKYGTQIEEYERSIALAEQELAESETLREWILTAPEAGTVTAVIGEVGQSMEASRPLLSIVPAGAKLQAHLYADSRAIGFVEPGDSVYVRFRAYPYQKFGHQLGRVRSVSRTSASAIALLGADAGQSVLAKQEPMYRIVVELSAQEVYAYGKEHPLQTGMLVEADVLQETRRLYEWILEPLYALGHRVR